MNKAIKWLVFLFLGLFLLSVVIIRPYYVFITKTLGISPFKALISHDSLKIIDNQINLVVLGVAGVPKGDTSHDAPLLTDSIIVINYNFKTNKISTMSVPRDIWDANIEEKINAAYAVGGCNKGCSTFSQNDGLTLAKAEIGSITGLPIQYAGVVNFDGFKELIDYVGGIDVNVEHSFVDHHYPIDGKENDLCGGDPTYACRYQTISFTKGKTHMDGKTSLIFVRSRYAEGDEGTDFAREARQQKVIEALKNKLISLMKKPDIKTYNQLYSLFNNIVNRDITNQQMAIIMKNIIFKGMPTQQKIAFDSLLDNPVMTPNKYGGGWVLIPTDGDGNFDHIHKYIQCQISSAKNCK